jgi:uncharacterized FlaG/YvyC family protein
MKVSAVQKNAKEWVEKLNKLNSADVGQIAITYTNELGKKAIGYLDPLDLELQVDNVKFTLGELLEKNVNFINDLQEKVEALEKFKGKLDKFLQTIGGNLNEKD